MKKKLISLLLAMVLALSMTLPAFAAAGDRQRTADALNTLNLVKGTAAGYRLDDGLTRAQAAVLLVRLAGAEKLTAADPWFAGFSDMPAWAAEEINYAVHRGWIRGVNAYEFHPNADISANAWCTMLLRMVGYSDKNGDFTVENAAQFARQIGLVSRDYSDTMSRGETFSTMYDALTFAYRDGGTVIERLVENGVCTRAVASALGLFDRELTARQAADRYLSAVMGLELYQSREDFKENKVKSNASAFFISEDGLAVTNYHAISGYPCGTVTLVNGTTYPVERVLFYDENMDVAVIRVSKTSVLGQTIAGFACLEMAGTAEICAGDTVYALGNPLGLGLSVSSGIISDIARTVKTYSLPCVMNTADISKGSSGGALMNVYGQVISITSGAYTYGNSMYLSVPVDPIMKADLTGEGWTLEEAAEIQAQADKLKPEKSE